MSTMTERGRVQGHHLRLLAIGISLLFWLGALYYAFA